MGVAAAKCPRRSHAAEEERRRSGSRALVFAPCEPRRRAPHGAGWRRQGARARPEARRKKGAGTTTGTPRASTADRGTRPQRPHDGHETTSDERTPQQRTAPRQPHTRQRTATRNSRTDRRATTHPQARQHRPAEPDSPAPPAPAAQRHRRRQTTPTTRAQGDAANVMRHVQGVGRGIAPRRPDRATKLAPLAPGGIMRSGGGGGALLPKRQGVTHQLWPCISSQLRGSPRSASRT